MNPQLDRDLEMIALRCLQKPVDLRYESAAALADDLEAYLNDEAISAHSGHLWQVCSRLFRETHHAPVLEHWGLLWMWHSLVLFIVCLLTNVLYWLKGTAWDEFASNRWCYFFLWTAGLGTWAAVFWFLRKRMGPVTFVERQIAHIWGAGMLSVVLLFPVEAILKLEVLKLSPVLALSSGMVFLIKGGILTRTFYVQAIVLFLTALVMGQYPHFGPLIFGAVSAACFFLPGLKYHRQRLGSAGKP